MAWKMLMVAVGVILFTVTGCQDGRGSDLASLPEPEPGDPMFYAPEGWPLKIGDRISWGEWGELDSRFLGVVGQRALHVANGTVFAARFGEGRGTMVGETNPRGRGLNQHFIYEGHFPVTFPEGMRSELEDLLPERFHSALAYHTVAPKHPTRKHSSAPPPSLIIDLGEPMVVDRDGEPVAEKKKQ